jgi:hypothetical protein
VMVGGQAFTNIYTIGCAPPPMHNLNFSIGMPCRPFHAQTKTTDQVSCPPVPSAHSQVDPAPAGFKGSPPLTTSSHAHVHEWRNVDSEHAQPLGPLCVIFSSTCIPRATSIMEAVWNPLLALDEHVFGACSAICCLSRKSQCFPRRSEAVRRHIHRPGPRKCPTQRGALLDGLGGCSRVQPSRGCSYPFSYATPSPAAPSDETALLWLCCTPRPHPSWPPPMPPLASGPRHATEHAVYAFPSACLSMGWAHAAGSTTLQQTG